VRLTLVTGLCVVLSGALVALGGCTNDPYPDADAGKKILYTSYSDPPKTLDPAVAYAVTDHVVIGSVFDTLLEYHYLRRPYELIPGLAEALPEAQVQPNGHQSYRFRLRTGILFHEDPCFGLSQQSRRTREVRAADVAFQLARLADPAVNSPAAATFGDVLGFAAFAKRLVDMRKASAAFAALPVHEQYQGAGGIEGVVVHGDLDLEIVLSTPNPQILYWFAMPFTTPMAWEAIAYYDGKQGRANLSDRAVGTGPFRLALYEKQHRFVLERNDAWYGRAEEHFHTKLGPDDIKHYRRLLNADAPGAVFPTEIDPDDIKAGHIDPASAGRRLPFLDEIRFTREKETIPDFNKFLQGYYDVSIPIIKESFDAIVVGGHLSKEMQERGMRLDKEVEPSIFFIAFNMDDPVVGARGGEKAMKLRQAMSLAIDAEQFMQLFLNGRGVASQSPVPPGIFGYDKDYKNPFRQPDLARARTLLAEAGYPNGIDPATGQPLRLTFDNQLATAEALLQWEFFARAWRDLGLDVEVKATTFNQYQEKLRRGAYQVVFSGWGADFPDPENFFFLLECGNAQSKINGPNIANFCNAEFDRLYRAMKTMSNNAERAGLIKQMVAILERERPWIEIFFRETYTLNHAWVVNAKPMGISYPTYKYKDVRPELRARIQATWNAPVRWPLYLLLIGLAAAVVPAIRTYYRERL
jgi:oligopeptide transport system substrate-binding protein